MKRILILSFSHLLAAAAGFALGIYILPILTAPPAPTAADVSAAASGARFTGEFRRDLEDSDALHWGEGTVYVGPGSITLQGSIAPGPNYKLYLSPDFVETERDFARLRSTMVEVGDVRTFENFIVAIPPTVDPAAYNTVIVWCEAFEQFITAARYQ